MAGIIFHTVIADRLIEEWSEPSGSLLSDPDCITAFHNGSWAPDQGCFPGGNAEITDLCHYQNSGDFCSCLLSLAESPKQKAFAWGWLSHYVADFLIHPAINRGVGELIYGDKTRSVAWEDDSEKEHQQIEIGLDAYIDYKLASKTYRPYDNVMQAQDLDFVSEAFQKIYGKAYSVEEIYSSLSAGLKGARTLFMISRIISTRFFDLPLPGDCRLAYFKYYLPIKTESFFLRKKAKYYGLANTLYPQDWLVQESSALFDKTIEKFFGLLQTAGTGLPNYNLGTGELHNEQLSTIGG